MRGTKRFKAFHFLAPIFDGGGSPLVTTSLGGMTLLGSELMVGSEQKSTGFGQI
jgi:hypothetical protein